jgi:glycosyltransferase involved in cell wall biosynthesis
MQVSVLLLAYNEARNLPRCLEALGWCDDIVVLDSGSTDGTIDLARAYGARILSRAFDNFAAQRNFGLAHAGFRHDWVLHLDADEVATPQFVSKLQALAPPPGVDGYLIPSKLILYGTWLRRSGMYPTYQARLGHAGRLRFLQVGHGQREDVPADRLAVFDEPYLHFSFSQGLRPWLAKHLRYAADEAQIIIAPRAELRRSWQSAMAGKQWPRGPVARRRLLKSAAAGMPLWLRPFARFFYIYFVRRGFLDGRAGFLYAVLLSIYEAMISILALDMLHEAKAAPRADMLGDRNLTLPFPAGSDPVGSSGVSTAPGTGTVDALSKG